MPYDKKEVRYSKLTYVSIKYFFRLDPAKVHHEVKG
jgi:hypothetical protein